MTDKNANNNKSDQSMLSVCVVIINTWLLQYINFNARLQFTYCFWI